MKIPTRKTVLLFLCGGLVAAVLCIIFAIVTTVTQIDDAYAQLGAAEMVMDYLGDNEGSWPSGWEDLRPYFEEHNGMVTGWSYEKYQQHIYIDFAADPVELRQQARSPEQATFDVIHAKGFLAPHFDPGPNAMLHGYLKNK